MATGWRKLSSLRYRERAALAHRWWPAAIFSIDRDQTGATIGTTQRVIRASKPGAMRGAQRRGRIDGRGAISAGGNHWSSVRLVYFRRGQPGAASLCPDDHFRDQQRQRQ